MHPSILHGELVGAGSLWPIMEHIQCTTYLLGFQIFNMHLTQGDGLIKTACIWRSGVVWSLESGLLVAVCVVVCFPSYLHHLSFENTHFFSFAASLEFLWLDNLAVPWLDCASSNDATCWGILVCTRPVVIWQFAIVHRFCFSGQVQCRVRRSLDKGQYRGWLAGWLAGFPRVRAAPTHDDLPHAFMRRVIAPMGEGIPQMIN